MRQTVQAKNFLNSFIDKQKGVRKAAKAVKTEIQAGSEIEIAGYVLSGNGSTTTGNSQDKTVTRVDCRIFQVVPFNYFFRRNIILSGYGPK